MYENIGKSIKTAAKVMFWIGVALSFGIAFILASLKSFSAYLVFFIGIGGIVVSWLANCVLYGFGELVDRSMSVDEKMNELLDQMDKVIEDVGAIRNNTFE